MGAFAGPNVEESGLVLALDGANYKSFKGESTTNVITNTNLDTGWSKGYNTSIQWNDYPPPDNVDSQVVSFVDSDGNGSGYWYSYGNYAPQSPSTTYTISVYARTIGSDWSIRAYTADNSETGRQFTNTVTIPGDGKWYRVVFNSITTPANTQSDSLSFQFTSIPAGQRCWLCAPQMEAKSYATNFVAGTRGDTVATGGGWADLTGNGNHGALVNGVRESSDNLGALVFDGSNDYIDLNTNNIITGTNPFTFEAFYKVTNASVAAELFGNYGSGYTSNTIWISGRYGVYINAAVPYFQGYPLGLGTYHMAFTRTSAGACTLYKNGVVDGTATSTTSISSGQNFRIGSDVNGIGEVFGGELYSLKVYNRALSTQEIQQNFNATRSRFGI